MGDRLAGRRVLVTHADRFMGVPVAERFRAEGAEVIADTSTPRSAAEGAAIVDAVGAVDVLFANLAWPPTPALVTDTSDEDWHALFDVLVHPLMGLVRAAAKAMKTSGSGRIIGMTSAAPLRGIPRNAAYCAARGAQNAYLRSAGLELARDGVLVTAIAQNYVENDTYYPPGLTEDEQFLTRMRTVVPAQRLGQPEETAALALFLATEAGFVPGQIFPLAGGWTTTL
ncbi:MAG: SDR family oxidoreductase [Pseudomonadales bacterium]|jgi:2-keto-3-deoxy-L-fuconate dehydrogenase|nr:SDR family oxidoreductase [Pseudomonadales bacterium]